MNPGKHKFKGKTAKALGAWLFTAALFLLLPFHSSGAAFSDSFVNRQVLTSPSGDMDGSNVGATAEVNEPRIGGEAPSRSVWISWVAPADGVATFWTDGSSFDTLLSAFYFGQPADTTLDKLKEAARNDDADVNPPSSLIQFGALAGVRYEIAIDGFAGATGAIRLRWDFVNATSPPPVILSVPPDQAAKQGDTVTLTVDMQTSTQLDLQWRYNGNSFGATGPTLVLTNLQPAQLGRYSLRIRIGAVRFETTPTEIQINSEGQTNALARDKLFGALQTPLRSVDDPPEGAGLAAGKSIAKAAVTGVVVGYNGSQIFNTTYATSDPAEPAHCGFASGSTYWFSYQAPTNGTLMLDTVGSSYDTVLSAYTYTNPPSSYGDLISITCDNDGVAPLGASRIEFAVLKGAKYAVVISGVNGAKGTAQLNYRLDTNRPPVAPTLKDTVLPRTIAAGEALTLRPTIIGSAPLHFSWSKAGQGILNATNGSLQFLNLFTSDSGNYSLKVWNHIGGPLDVSIPVRVVVPPRLQMGYGENGTSISFPTTSGQRYIIEEASSLTGPWSPLNDGYLGDGGNMVLTNSPSAQCRFYRVRVE
jgi:hypothetical protein